MQLEIGQIYEGTVRGITGYGAFVEIPQEGGKPITGMVHISEVANTYVTDIHEFLKEGQQVKVKVVSISEQGKISLSIRKTLAPEPKQGHRPPRSSAPEPKQGQHRAPKPKPAPREPRGVPGPEMENSGDPAFEQMMKQFRARSEDRLGDLRRNTDRKNGSRRRSK